MRFAIPDGYYLIVSYILAGVIGLCVGSFLNVVIYRVPRHMSLASPPSHCPKCGYQLRWYDNIPVISYLFLKGKCRSCREPISFRYTAVELLNMLLWLLSVWRFHDHVIWMAISIIVSSAALCVCFIDLENMIIPDRFHIILAVCAVPAMLADVDFPWYSHLIGLAAAGLIFWGTACLGEKILGREALGGGDIKLAAVSGFLLGWERALLMMLIASISGSVVMLVRKRRSARKESEETPFAPFLSAGLVIAQLFGAAIIHMYIGLLLS